MTNVIDRLNLILTINRLSKEPPTDPSEFTRVLDFKKDLLTQVAATRILVEEFTERQDDLEIAESGTKLSIPFWIAPPVLIIYVLYTSQYLLLTFLPFFILYGLFHFKFLKPKATKVFLKLDEEIDLIFQVLAKLDSPVPEDYLYVHALESIESYLKSKRADTIKEAINLYEQDIKHLENQRHMEEMNQNINKMSKEVKKLRSDVQDVEWAVRYKD
jgi:hypothetical protein